MKKKFNHILAFLLFFLLSIFILRGLIFNPGLAQYRDLESPYNPEEWRLFGKYTWDAYTQRQSQIQQKSIYYWLTLLSPEFSQRFIYVIIITLIGINMYYLLYETTHSSTTSFLAALFYMFNPIVTTRIQHRLLLLSYALLPIYFLTCNRALKNIQNYKNIDLLKCTIIISLLLNFMSTSPHWILFCSIIYIFIWIINLKRPLNLYLIKTVILTIIIGALYINISAFWVLPYLHQINLLKPPYVFTMQILNLLSRNANIFNVIRLHNFWWPENLFHAPPISLGFYFLITTLVPFIAFSAILFRRNKLIIMLTIFTLGLILLGKGNMPPFGEFYEWIVFYAPITSKFGWIFRDPHKWAFILNFCYSFLIGLSLLEIVSKLNFYNSRSIISNLSNMNLFRLIIIMVIFLFIPLYNGYPLLSGDLAGNIRSTQLPTDYEKLHNWMIKQDGNFKIAVFPDRPSFGTPMPTISYDHFWRYVIESLLNNKIRNFGSLLNPWNVKYLVVRTEVLEDINYVISSLVAQVDLELVKKFGSLYVFRNKNFINHISIPNQNFVLTSGLNKYTSLTLIELFNVVNSSSLFLDKVSFEKNYEPILIVDNLVMSESAYLDLVISLMNKGLIIEPFDHTQYHKPQNFWSKASATDPLHGQWHPYLKQRSIENWDFDYGIGLVFTWVASKLKENPMPTSNDLINQWTYNTINDLNQWKNQTRETQFGALHPLTLDNYALKAELWNSTGGWKTINSPLIPAEYSNWYKWELQIKGENAHGVHIKIIEYGQEQKIVNARHVKSVGSGNFDWNTTTLNYTPEKPETKYIQLQIWHGHETTQPFPNAIWINHLKIYDLKGFVEPVTLEIPYTIPKTDQYILLARVFQNQQGGRILVQNDKEHYPIYTRDQLNKFTWIQLDNVTLQQGQHTLTFTNLEGFNAVNLFALVPAQDYREAQTRLTENLQDKRIIHILEAESDLYHNNTATSNKYGGEASNGEALELTPGSIIWREIETVKPSNYTIVIRSRGNLNIKLDDKTYTAETMKLDWTYQRPIPLEVGTHKIEITPSTIQLNWRFADGLQGWTANAPNIQTLAPADSPINGENRLMVELTASTPGWKTIISPLIPTTYETTYEWSLQTAGENVHKAHITIVEYDQDKKPLTGKHVASVGDGNFTWTPISFQYTPTPNATYIALQLWHGHETTQPLPNRIWVDDVQVTGCQPSDLDVVWIYSTNEPTETLEDVFRVDEAPAEIIEYKKIDPTKYTIKVDATEPFMLSFAESYNSLWVAWVDGEKVSSLPLYSVINGFWINKTGTLEITIEYEPQRWFYMGSAISVATLIACAIYLTHDWMKNKDILKRVRKWSRSNSS